MNNLVSEYRARRAAIALLEDRIETINRRRCLYVWCAVVLVAIAAYAAVGNMGGADTADAGALYQAANERARGER
jgi:hypothetical protein